MSREFASIGVARHRIGIDGEGVTTLVAGFGCPLDCRYCLNPQCKTLAKPLRFTVESLYDKVKLDSLYFEATGGGITFGGGEPMLQQEFLAEFIAYVKSHGHGWKFFAETSLAVDDITPMLGLIDAWIVDIKDMNPEIYERYTSLSSAKMRRNLELLRPISDSVTVRVPLIEGYNTVADCDASERELRALGFQNIDRFKYKIS